ncbi:helix-turn-helix domain-containing protein [Streptomyces chumphonensis]|uniref:helix-turn-helix domain-containing protein n=1 Tax=Streptomyces chumphonensis TaxID=1214925 RepID=UPI003D745096
MARKAIEHGPTTATVAANLARLRKACGFTTRGLAEAVVKAGRRVPDQSAISSIENGRRRVDVDDLTTLAAVLGVTPAALLLPLTPTGEDMVEVSGVGAVTASNAWTWALGRSHLHQGRTGREAYEAALRFDLYGRPHWLNGGEV